MTRSLQIRSLSMPPERLDENASHFYQQFNDNFMRIKALIRENREVLDTRVYRLLKKYPDITEQDADKLIEFSDALADTRTLEMVDVQTVVDDSERAGAVLRHAAPRKVRPGIYV